jgi:hypothetical protein
MAPCSGSHPNQHFIRSQSPAQEVAGVTSPLHSLTLPGVLSANACELRLDETPSGYNRAQVDQPKQWPRLIGSRFTAAIGVVLTGYVAAETLRAALWQSPHHFHWLLPVDTFLPARATLVANVALYAWVLWLCIVFPRALHGKERILAIGWMLSLLLSLIQGLLSASLAALIQYVRAASIMVAFFGVLAILIEGRVSGDSASDSKVPE